MYKKIAVALTCSLIATSAQAKPEAPPAWSFTTVDAPGFATYSYVVTMNKHGDVAGWYDDATGGVHGYVRSESGQVTTIDFPGALATAAATVTDDGDVVGTYIDATGLQHGFSLHNGEFTTIDFPGATRILPYQFEFGPGLGTAVAGMNKHGDIVGQYGGSDDVAHGFVWSDGVFTSFDAPTGTLPPGTETLPTGINKHGDIIGGFHVGPGPTTQSRGFLLRDGQITVLQVPEAVDTFGTITTGINDGGDIVGSYSGPTHGFFDFHGFALIDGEYTRIDVPDALATETFGINEHGDIVGAYLGPDFRLHGYIGARID